MNDAMSLVDMKDPEEGPIAMAVLCRLIGMLICQATQNRFEQKQMIAVCGEFIEEAVLEGNDFLKTYQEVN